MTEQEWLAATDSTPMLSFMRDLVHSRKLRLFACACCREIWQSLVDERSRTAVEVAERYADGQASEDQLHLIREDAYQAHCDLSGPLEYRWAAAAYNAACPSNEVVFFGCIADAAGAAKEDIDSDRTDQAVFLRDIFGNPFRPVCIDQSWRTTTVVSIARTMYDSRDFSPMPMLADALQDAGCENEDILNHCRSGGPHVRGCWVVDLILGKE